jgi:hypothetical protein
MESRNRKLCRSDMKRDMPPRWGFLSLGVSGYNYVAPPELKTASSVAAPRAALIQWQCSAVSCEEREKLSCSARHSLINDLSQRGQNRFPRLAERARVRAEHFFFDIETD